MAELKTKTNQNNCRKVLAKIADKKGMKGLKSKLFKKISVINTSAKICDQLFHPVLLRNLRVNHIHKVVGFIFFIFKVNVKNTFPAAYRFPYK
jgi:hypothetical protein